MSINIKKK